MKKLAIVLCMLLCFSLNVSAIDILDVNQKGSITITLKDPKTNEPIKTGAFGIYKVADVVMDNGNPKYIYTETFSEATTSLDNLESKDLLQSTIDYIKAYKVQSTTQAVKDGKVIFNDLTIGLYLVENTVKMDGCQQVSSFLISVPNVVNDHYNYHVVANPKMSIQAKPTTPPQEVPPEIPVTGVLWWPVPVLSILGILLISIGYIKKFRYEKNI